MNMITNFQPPTILDEDNFLTDSPCPGQEIKIYEEFESNINQLLCRKLLKKQLENVTITGNFQDFALLHIRIKFSKI